MCVRNIALYGDPGPARMALYDCLVCGVQCCSWCRDDHEGECPQFDRIDGVEE